MRCDQQNNDTPTHSGNLAYAWDFSLNGTSGDADFGLPIVAVEDGLVVYAQDAAPGVLDAWGKCVVVKYASGQYGLEAHLSQIFVKVNEPVLQGQVVASLGNADGYYANGAHIHYQRQTGATPNAVSVASTFQEAGNPVDGSVSQSTNDGAFTREFAAMGGQSAFGAVTIDIGWTTAFNTNTRYFSSDGRAQTCYWKRYASSGGGWYRSGIIYDALGGARKAYTIHTGFWEETVDTPGGDGWSEDGTKIATLGMPLTEEYSWSGGTRQDFQRGYLQYASGDVTVHSLTNSPGWTSSGWDNTFSYLFALAYERNGAATAVGSAQGPATQRSYGSGSIWVQEFDGGANGPGSIVYDPNNASGNSSASNEAYYVYGKFRDNWNALWNGSPHMYTVPTRDWYWSRDPKHWDQSTEYALQNFLERPLANQHYAIMTAYPCPPNSKAGLNVQNTAVVFNSSYAFQLTSVTPSSVTNVQQGDAFTITFQGKNTGDVTWSNDAVNFPSDLATLKSCDVSGAIVPSFLYDGTWIDQLTACTMLESSVAPGGTATFQFTGRVSATAPTGSVSVYFRPAHAIGGNMEGWSTSFKVDLFVESKIVRQLAGDLTGDGKADVVLVTNGGVYLYRSTGSGFVDDGRIDTWTPNDRPCLLADVLGQGRCQLISWGVDGVSCQMYDAATNPKLGAPIRLSYWSPDPATMRVKAGDVDNNGTKDLVIQTPTQLLTQRSWWSGSYDQQLHLQTWANWSSFPYQLLVGDFDPDGQADVLFSIPGDRTYYKYSTGSTFGSNIVLENWAFSASDSLVTGYFTTDHRVGIMRSISAGCDVLVPVGSAYQGPYHWSSWAPYPSQALVGDVNGDGLDDVIAVFPTTRQVSVLLNDTGQRFSGPFTWYTGSGTAQPFGMKPVVRPAWQLSFSLRQNPTTGPAFFKLTLPTASQVSVDIYDIRGRRVGSIQSFLGAGEHEVAWPNREPAGIYLARLRTEQSHLQQKFVLLK